MAEEKHDVKQEETAVSDVEANGDAGEVEHAAHDEHAGSADAEDNAAADAESDTNADPADPAKPKGKGKARAEELSLQLEGVPPVAHRAIEVGARWIH